ncbi:hypothetical protein [Streptomyces paromomycinus]|uniref:Uncharacterized protein n=1 Tax=Streptomyces paromomycinus TaxID=92743 RepID=A0A401VUT2_STREY|nr:hypothetical protein [Streptomyces paromomycinus]GCD40801.1 hypothetical protein GKJPGBOP_00454 [Streptomyces paromomycinus]
MAAARRTCGQRYRRLPLDLVREEFARLSTGHGLLRVDGAVFAGLPGRVLGLGELRGLLLRPQCPAAVRDAVWVHLVARARAEGGCWTVACAGMALPALVRVAAWVAARYPGEVQDAEAEVLAGFFAGLATVDLGRPHVLLRVVWAARRAGFTALTEALEAPVPVAPRFGPAPPHPGWGHPDLVLARAVGAAVLTPAEAELIGTTRLEHTPVLLWAREHEAAAQSVYARRRRAEHRLAAYLCDRPPPPVIRAGQRPEPGRGAYPCAPGVAYRRTRYGNGGNSKESSMPVHKSAVFSGLRR